MLKIVCVVSGGMDSVTVLHKLVSENGAENIKAISFDYDQIHKKELGMAAWQCEQLGVERRVDVDGRTGGERRSVRVGRERQCDAEQVEQQPQRNHGPYGFARHFACIRHCAGSGRR